jgi:hypothetical protein
MSTARPSWRVPIRNSAATIVSGLVHTATSAIAAKVIPQSSAIDPQLFQSLIASHASISSRVTSSRHEVCGCPVCVLRSSSPPISHALRAKSSAAQRVSAGAVRCGMP